MALPGRGERQEGAERTPSRSQSPGLAIDKWVASLWVSSPQL